MRVDISNIVKSNGASMDLEFHEGLDGMETISEDHVFGNNFEFIGKLANTDGILRLTGRLKAEYSTVCYRCLKPLNGVLDLPIGEIFEKHRGRDDDEVYVYADDSLDIDKPLRDNIILSLPMKRLCSEECKGLCPKCGKDLNLGECNCGDDDADPRMKSLNDYFKSM